MGAVSVCVRVNVPASIIFCSKMRSPVIRHGNPHAQVHTLSVSTNRKINSTERDCSLIFIRLAHSTSQLDPQILVRNQIIQGLLPWEWKIFRYGVSKTLMVLIA